MAVSSGNQCDRREQHLLAVAAGDDVALNGCRIVAALEQADQFRRTITSGHASHELEAFDDGFRTSQSTSQRTSAGNLPDDIVVRQRPERGQSPMPPPAVPDVATHRQIPAGGWLLSSVDTITTLDRNGAA